MVPISDDRPTPRDPQAADAQTTNTRVTDGELAALERGELDELDERRLRARLALDPTGAPRLAALRAGVHLTDDQKIELERRLVQHPELTAEDLEMSDEAATRIVAAIDAEAARRPAPPD